MYHMCFDFVHNLFAMHSDNSIGDFTLIESTSINYICTQYE